MYHFCPSVCLSHGITGMSKLTHVVKFIDSLVVASFKFLGLTTVTKFQGEPSLWGVLNTQG